MTGTLLKGIHLEMLNVRSKSVAFPFWPFGEYSSHASLGAQQAMYHISKSLARSCGATSVGGVITPFHATMG